MLRRSRFSVRPNIGAAGRTAAATSQEIPAASKEAADAHKNVVESSTASSECDPKAAEAPSEKPATQGDGNEPSAEASLSSAAVQRRKRFSAKPKVVASRPSALARAQKSPVKASSQSRVGAQDSTASDKQTPSSSPKEVSELSKGPLSPKNRRLSGENKQPKTQPKPSLTQSGCSEPAAVAHTEDLPRKCAESAAGIPTKDVSFKDKVSPSLPDKEAIAISERAKTLVSSRMKLSASPAAYTLSRLLNDRSDLQRLAKAQRLRDLMKKEVLKEKRKRRANLRAKEFTLDPAKMTMRDLIHYLPESNPMTTSLEEPVDDYEISASQSPERENTPETPQETEPPPKAASVSGEDEDEVAATEDEQEEALMVPQVKVAEDGSLIIDEESLTVEVQRAKGPNPANEREPIFERGSTTTYSSFRKGTYSKPWSNEETDMFFLAISMVGTDFSMICQLFPHRARSEIKNKFKKEERENAWRIDKAFKDRQKLDIEYFSKLLEKILEVQKNRKKLKSLAEKNSPKKSKRKPKAAKKTTKELSDVEEEDEEDMPDLEGEEEGEKENEDNCNDSETSGFKAKRKRKIPRGSSAPTNEPSDKKNKGDNNDEQEDDFPPEDAEAAPPGHLENSELCGPTEIVCKDAEIKPAKLSRGRAPRPVPQLGGRRGKKPPVSPKKPRDAALESANEEVADETPGEQGDEDVSPARQNSKSKSSSDGASSEDEGAAVLPLKPTRYGRMPKPTKPLTYPARDDSPSEPEEAPSSPSGCPAKATKSKCTMKKRKLLSKSPAAHKSKRPKLFTLRAREVGISDEEEEAEGQWDVEQQPQCSSTLEGCAFVPPSLCSPRLLTAEVEERVEELDVLVNMPDVLGITQDALCPDATCELAHNETGLAEPSEHQLDLLVDVIECLSSDYTIAEEESYNEAAHTLLTIGNVSQFPENEAGVQDQSTESEPTSRGSDPLEQVQFEAAVDSQEKTQDDDVPPKAAPALPLPCLEHFEKIPSPNREGHSPKGKPASNLGQASRDRTTTRPAASKLEKRATVMNKQDLLQHEDSPSIQGDSNDPDTFASPGEGAEQESCKGVSSRQSRRSIKLQPNLSKATRSTQSKPQTTQEPVQSSSGPKVDPEHVLPVKTSAAAMDEIGEHPISKVNKGQASGYPEETNVHHPQTAASSPKTDSGPDSASEGPHPPQPLLKSRFQKVKAKPNLTQAVRSSRSRHQVSKTSQEKISSPGLDAESHQAPGEQLGSTLVAELKSALVDDPCESSSTGEMKGEETADIKAKSGSDLGLKPVGELITSQTGASYKSPARSRFQKIKPKPNVALTSRSRPNLEVSSCAVTLESEVHPAELETEPAKVSLPETAAFASESSQSSDAAAPPTTQENLKEKKVGDLGQVESSATVAEIPIQVQAATAELDSQEICEEPSSLCKTKRREKVKPKPHLAARNPPSSTTASEVPDKEVAEDVNRTEKQLRSGQNQTEPAATAALPDVEQKSEVSSSGGRTDVENDQCTTAEGSAGNLPLRRRFSRVKPTLGTCVRKRSLEQQAKVSEGSLAGDHKQQEETVCESLLKNQAVALGTKSESETCSSPKLSESANKLDMTQPPGICLPSLVENVQSEDAVEPLGNSSESESKSQPTKSTGKAPQGSRGRLVRPKPNVALGRRVPQQKESRPKDAVTLSQVAPVPVDGEQAPEGHTDTLRPAGGATQQPTATESSDVGDQPRPGDISASPEITQVEPSNLLQDGQASAGANQSQSGLKLFSEMLPEQVPSDPDEPFFILSLTEVPLTEVPLTEVVVGLAPEPTVSPPASLALQSDESMAVNFITVSETLQDSAEAGSENPADTMPAKGKKLLSESKQQRLSQEADTLPTRPRTSTEERTACVSRDQSGDCTDVTQEASPGQEEAKAGRSKFKAKSATGRRNQGDAASTCESVAAPPPEEAPPLGEAASSAWGDSSVDPAALELTWGEDELLDWQSSGVQEGGCKLGDDEPTAVSQYFLGDIFTEVESE